jgi:signal transduction histidine kinase
MFSTIMLFLTTSLVSIFIRNIDEKSIQDLIYILRICIQLLLLPAVYYWLCNPYKKVLGLVPDKIINLMSLYPVIAFLLLINTYTAPFGGFNNFNSRHEVFLLLAFIILGYFLVFAGISSSSRMISLQYNYKIIENQVELQRQNYKKLNESLEQLYAAKHDFKHHISAISTMLQQKKQKDVLEYIEQFNKNELSKTLPTLCHNFTADSIIKYYMSLAISKNIDFRHQLNIPEDISINPLDLCVVLGNCLENAIEACEKLGYDHKKAIEIVSHIVDSHIIFKIKNNYDGQIIKVGEIIHSSKNDYTYGIHGIGLNSVKETVAHYKGNLDIKYTQDVFEVDIIMNINCTN